MRIILALAFLIAWSMMHSQILAQGHNQKGAQHRSSTKAETHGSESDPIIVKILPSTKSDADAKKEEEERGKRDSAEQLKQKTDNDLVTFTGKLADYTWLLFCVGVLQFGILVAQIVYICRQEKATKTIERAYVKMSHESPGLKFNGMGGVAVQMHVRNFGKTPARVSSVVLDSRYIENIASIPPDPPMIENRVPVLAFLVEGDEFWFSHQRALGVPMMDKVQAGDGMLLVWGHIVYTDAFDRRHRAGYGRIYNFTADLEYSGVTKELHDKRSNLDLVTQQTYNYDRPYKEGQDI
jgi:hypothetical protein